MNNYVQPGDAVTIASAPSGGLTAGQGYQVGQLFGVVAKTVSTAETYVLQTTGVVTLPKQSDASEAWTVGALIYWDATNAEATTVASLNLLIGVCVEVAAHDAATGKVRLNGIAAAQNGT